MDYTEILNTISGKLSQIITLLTEANNDSSSEFLIILFAIFLVLWIMRGE